MPICFGVNFQCFYFCIIVDAIEPNKKNKNNCTYDKEIIDLRVNDRSAISVQNWYEKKQFVAIAMCP